VITVQVGSYVSGPIQAIYADFNSPVKQGQLIAKIDPRPFKVKVDAAKAVLRQRPRAVWQGLSRSAYKKINYQRNAELLKDGAISKDAADLAFSTYNQAKSQVGLDAANIQQQQANLEDSQVQLTTAISSRPSTARSFRATSTSARPWLELSDADAFSYRQRSHQDAGGFQRQRVDYRQRSCPGWARNSKSILFPIANSRHRPQVRQAPITVQNVVTYDVVVNVDNPSCC